jgi:hypothetical protein
MYLVELKPGKEELYRTGDELAIAIRDGDVDSRSRIYHRATAKWISITLHPQYKAIVTAAQSEPVRQPRKVWGLLPTSLTSQPVEVSSADAPRSDGGVHQRWKGPTGLGLAGILLVLGIQLAFSGPRPPWAGERKSAVVESVTDRTSPAQPPSHGQPIRVVPDDYDGTEMVSLASTTTAWPSVPPVPADSIEAPPPLPEIVPSLPRAPKLRTKALRAALTPAKSRKAPAKASSVEALLNRYEAASNEAYTRLESGIRVARLQRLFSPARLTPGGGVTDTRLSLAGAANFIRVYRQQQAKIDRTFQDSVTLLAKRHKWKPTDMKQWTSRPRRIEDPTLELLSGTLLAGIDSILGVLDAEAGAYKVRGSAIAFEDPAATQAYAALRRRIIGQIEAAVAAGGATSLGPTGLLLQAIGTSTLPRET